MLIDRIPKNENPLFSRSHCEFCKKKLEPLDLIPILSFIALKGKCRYCHVRIPTRLILVELLSGALFIYIWQTIPNFNILQFVFIAAVFSLLIVIFFIDLEKGIIPNNILAVLIFCALIYWLIFQPQTIALTFVVGIFSFLVFFILFLVTRGRGIGFGDVKFAFFMGFFLGFPNVIFALYIAFLTGALISLILIVIGKKKLRGDTIPFGPFLVIGVAGAYFLGEQILKIVGPYFSF